MLHSHSKPVETASICHRIRSKAIAVLVSLLLSVALICAITISVPSTRQVTTVPHASTNDEDSLDRQPQDPAEPARLQKSTEALAARVEELWNQQQLMYRVVTRPDLDLSNLYPDERASEASPIPTQKSEEYLFASTSIGGNARSDESVGPDFAWRLDSQSPYGILLDPWELDEFGIVFGGADDLGTPNERKIHRSADKWHLKTKNQIALELLDNESVLTMSRRAVPQVFYNKNDIDDSAKIYTEENKNLRDVNKDIARRLWAYSDGVKSKTQAPAIVSQAEIIVQTSQFDDTDIWWKRNELVVSFKANAVLGMFIRESYPEEHWVNAQDEFLSHFGIRLPVFHLITEADGSKRLMRMKTDQQVDA